jgi:hypothetical protein
MRSTDRLMTGFNREVSTQRLLAYCVSTSRACSVEVQDTNLGTTAQLRRRCCCLLSLWQLIVGITGGCMAVAIDMTVGERGSLGSPR